jgi:hypothetical protein
VAPADRIDRIAGHLTEALADLEELKGELPPFAVDSGRFLVAEVKVIGKRLENMRRVVVGPTRPAA